MSDISPLKTLSSLRSIAFGGAQISDFAPLGSADRACQHRRDLLGDDDLDFLTTLVNLEELKAPQNAIADLAPLGNLSKLKSLSLNHNAVKDVTPLVSNAALTSGAKIDLTDNPIDCAEQAANLGNLVARGVTISTGCP